ARRAPVAPRRRGPVPAEQRGAPGARGLLPGRVGAEDRGRRFVRPVGRRVGAAAEALRGGPFREQVGVPGAV
ncbi:MAG: hypothetical protein AVDCRST_MAG01-01-3495, partial [uncultured Rubrobacteraceae bacterium]